MDYLVFHRMGKVGSHSIYHSLRTSVPGLRIDQAHFLTPRAIEKSLWMAKAGYWNSADSASIQVQVKEALCCAEEMQKRRRQGKPYCVLSGYRDPLDQVVATVFQILPVWFPEIDATSPALDEQAAFMVQKFHSMFRHLIVEKCPPSTPVERRFRNVFVQGIEWFDKEFEPVHGVDLYQHRPDNLGVFRITHGAVLHLVYRTESLRSQFREVLSQVPGVRGVKQINENEGEKKTSAALYRAFRCRFQPTPEMHDFYYNSRFFRHFYPNIRPHFAFPDAASAPVVESGSAAWQPGGVSSAELEAVRRQLREARSVIERMKSTKGWRFRTLLRRLLLRAKDN